MKRLFFFLLIFCLNIVFQPQLKAEYRGADALLLIEKTNGSIKEQIKLTQARVTNDPDVLNFLEKTLNDLTTQSNHKFEVSEIKI